MVDFMKNIKILLVHGEAGQADAISHLSENGALVTAERIESPESFRAAARKLSPNVVIADQESTGLGARDVVEVARRELPGVPVIIVSSARSQHEAIDGMREGAESVVMSQRLDRLTPIIDAALEIRRPLKKLTPRQIEVLRMVAEGGTTREIADQLGLSMKTVESHRGAIMKRLGLHNVAAVVRYAVRTGIVSSAVIASRESPNA